MLRIWRNKPETRLRDYVYVSDAKLDMLYEQVPVPLRKRIAAEVKIDLKVIGITVKDAGDKNPVRMGQLAIIERFIEEERDVGTIQEPRSYFRGTMNMKYGPLGSYEFIVLFHGREGGNTVGLGGSSWHLLGGQRPMTEFHAYSHSPTLWVALAEQISADPAGAEWVRREREGPSHGPSEEAAVIHDAPPDAVLHVVDWLEPEGPVQRVEFLARRLVDGDFPARAPHGRQLPPGHITLGTPL
jgi:hypothetical protein